METSLDSRRPSGETAADSKRVTLSVSITNPNERTIHYLAIGELANPPHVPVLSVEYRQAGKWRGFLDHDPLAQPTEGKGIQSGQMEGGTSVVAKVTLPTDWERMRVGFAWRMGEQQPPYIISWSREVSRDELDEKIEPQATDETQPPDLKVLSIVKHATENLRGVSLEVEVHNPNREPISYYGFAPTAFSPPTPAGRISPFGSRYEVTRDDFSVTKDTLIECPVGGARLELQPGSKAVYSVWAPVADDWDSIRIGLTWINGKVGEGEETTWSEPIR